MSKGLILAAICLQAAAAGICRDTPTMGWSSWNTYRNDINEELIARQAESMVAKGLRNAGYTYINIDDGAFDGRDARGNLRINSVRFPGGMKRLVDFIHSLGLKAGTYSDAGRNTCASFYDNDSGGVGTGLYGHDRQDMEFLLDSLGFDFIKVDFCGGDPRQNSEQLDLDEATRYREIRAAIDSTGRRDVRFNVCRWNYPGTWVENMASSWRISEDIRLSRESVKGIIAQNLYLSAYATGGRYNDMDMLEVGRGLEAEDEKTHFGMWCIMSSPLLIGCDLTRIPEETLELITNPELIAINQDTLGLQAYVADAREGVYLLVKDIIVPQAGTRAIAVYNSTDTDAEYMVDFNTIVLGGKIAARDCMERRDMGSMTGGMRVKVPAHGTRIYTLNGEKRLERTRYEAETGRMSAYQELTNHKAANTGVYEADAGCSGGMKAAWLGGSADNDLQWRNVYSASGGEYLLSVAWKATDGGMIHIEVNGKPVGMAGGAAAEEVRVTALNTPVTLSAGENTIRLYNGEERMPDIDYIEIHRVSAAER